MSAADGSVAGPATPYHVVPVGSVDQATLGDDPPAGAANGGNGGEGGDYMSTSSPSAAPRATSCQRSLHPKFPAQPAGSARPPPIRANIADTALAAKEAAKAAADAADQAAAAVKEVATAAGAAETAAKAAEQVATAVAATVTPGPPAPARVRGVFVGAVAVTVALVVCAGVLGWLLVDAHVHSKDKAPMPFSVKWDADPGLDDVQPEWHHTPPGLVTNLMRQYHQGPQGTCMKFLDDAVTMSCKFATTQESFWSHKADMVCNLAFFGRYAHDTFISHVKLASDRQLVVQANGHTQRLNNGDIPQPIQVTMNLGVQDHLGENTFAAYPSNSLPFDLYVGAWLEVTKGANVTGTQRVPLLFELTHGFNAIFSINPVQYDPTTLGDTMLLIRGQVYMDSILVFLLKLFNIFMWIITGITVIASFVWVINACPGTDRANNPLGDGPGSSDLLSFSAALLFALPQLRTLWPLAPPSGTMFDIYGIYGQLICLSVAIIAQLVRRFCYDWPYTANQNNNAAQVP